MISLDLVANLIKNHFNNGMGMFYFWVQNVTIS